MTVRRRNGTQAGNLEGLLDGFQDTVVFKALFKFQI